MSLRSLFIYPILLVITMGFISCDSTTSPENPLADSVFIKEIEINPTKVTFNKEEHGYTDTTISIRINALISNSNNLNPLYVISEIKSGDIVADGVLDLENSGAFNYFAETEIQTTTTTIEQHIVNVFFIDGLDVYAETYFDINGFPNDPPVIIETSSPDSINRPQSGEIPAIFTAKVTDIDGQENIQQVFIRVINQESGEVQGSPFQMYDDGVNYDDQTANDSVYTWRQGITPTDNNPNRDFDIEFFAIDRAGLSSDTVRTTFRIRE